MNLNSREFKIILASVQHYDATSSQASERQLMNLTGFTQRVIQSTLSSLQAKKLIKIECSEVHVTDLGIQLFLSKIKG